jgi:putative N-acetyltransferase (TIGR04045 family)
MSHITCKLAEGEAERQGHFTVRQVIFVEEQGLFFGSDVDAYDEEALHLIAVDEDTGEVVGAVRCYEIGEDTWYGGRLAVLKGYRQEVSPIGPRLVKLAEQAVGERGCQCFLAHIQLQNVRFFQRLGWRKVGSPEIYCGQPHQLMEAPSSSTNMPERSVAYASASTR